MKLVPTTKKGPLDHLRDEFWLIEVKTNTEYLLKVKDVGHGLYLLEDLATHSPRFITKDDLEQNFIRAELG